MPLRDGSNIPPNNPTTNFFDVFGPETSRFGDTRSLNQTAQPDIMIEPQANGSSFWGDALNGIRNRFGETFNSVLDAVAANEIDRQFNEVEARHTSRGDVRDQPQGTGAAPVQPSFFENKQLMIAGGVGVALLVALALATR